MFIHRGLVFGAVGAALAAGVLTSAFARPEATPTAAETCYGVCTGQTPSVTLLSLSRREVSYGHEQSATFRVVVRQRGFQATGTPTGTVTVETQTMTLCTITLQQRGFGSSGSCSLTATELQPGFDRVKAVYSGDSTFSSSTSASRLLVVRRGFGGFGPFPFGRQAGSKDLVPRAIAREW
jgi:Bacterial Ig-like domain (group 3)